LIEHTAVTQRAREVMRLLGLQEPSAPGKKWRATEFPEDMSTLSSDELSQQLTTWTGMLNFADYQRACVTGDRDHLRIQIKRRVEDHLELEKNKARTVTEKKAAGAKLAREIEDKAEEADAVLNLLTSFCESFTRNYNAVSREISRRGTPSE
jgi:hypothetical protein